MISQYLALYTGPNGPISATFDAESDRRVELLARIERDRGEWYDNADNVLGHLRERLTAAARALGEAAVECEECEESAEW